jgi:hypothetical protein
MSGSPLPSAAWLPAIAGALALSCAPAPNGGGGSDSGAAAHTCDSEATRSVFIVQQIGFARSDAGVGWGFDLDEQVSDIGDAAGCGKQDLTDPLGNPGIDNALAGLVPVLEQTEAAAAEGLLQASINEGELLLAIEVLGLDDWQDDDCVTVTLGQVDGDVLLGTNGLLLDGLSWAWAESEDRSMATEAWVEDGALHARGMALTLELQVITAVIALPLEGAALRLELDPSAPATPAQFGGGMSVANILDIVQNNGIDQGLKDLLATALPAAADLQDADGACSSMSAALELQAAPAFIVEP